MPIDKVKDSVQNRDYLVRVTELKNMLANAFNKSKDLKGFLECCEEITVNNIDKAFAGLILLATFDNNYVFYESADDEKEKIEAKRRELESEKQQIEDKKKELAEAEKTTELRKQTRTKKTKLEQKEQRIEAKKTELELREQQIEAEKSILDSIRKAVVAKEDVKKLSLVNMSTRVIEGWFTLLR